MFKYANVGIDKIGYFVRWNAYGEWKQTSAIWSDKKDAENHVKHLEKEDYNKNIVICETDLSAG